MQKTNSNFARSLAVLTLLLLLQFGTYTILLKPFTSTWGATDEEISAPMAGDQYMPFVKSTRAITIATSKEEVWKCLMGLGADRNGFYSYSFVENALVSSQV